MSDLRRIAESFGARPEQLADGSLVAMLPSKSLPREQAVRAARCALAMREGWRDGPVTLVTGRAVVERVPVGDALDRAAGALAGAPLDAVRIDALTADLLDERFDVQPDGRFFRLMAERSEASTDRIAHTAERTVLGRRTPFVGRERERAMLEAAWEATKRGSGAAAILIIAAPGIGKTRLVAEWVRGVQDAARGTECLLLTARADVLGGQAPYSVFSAAIRSWADIDGRGSEEARAELEARLIGLLGETRAAEVSPVLVSIALGYRGDDPSTMDALARGDRLRAALGTWFGAVAASGPVAVILEDLHLADAPSVAMIDDGLARFAERPFLVVALARPSIDDRFDRLWSERSLTTIRLAALSLGASRALVRASVGIAPSEEEIDRLLRRGEGNPLFLEEMIRARAEGAADTLPTTVLGVLQARLDGLDAEARRVLRAASIFGDRWTAAGVSTLMGDGFSESTVADWLRHLVGCEILSERHCGSPGASFSFRHDLLRETAYAMLTDADRALGHRLAASWLEAQPELASPLVLAEHHERGGDVSGTRRWLAEAAEMALEANDFELAIAHAERAIAGGAESTELARLKLAQAEAHCWRGRYGDGSRAAVTAVSASEVGTDLWFRAVGEVAFASAPLGVRDEIVAWAVRLRDQVVGSEQEPSPTRVRALCRVCLQAVLVGAFDLARELLALAEQFGGALARADPVLAARLHQARGFVALVDGLPELALREHGHAARCFAEGSSIRHAHFSNLQEAFSLLELGRYAETQALMIEALGAGESMGLLSTLPMMRILLAYSLVRQGREHDPVIELELARVPHDPGDLRADGGTRANLALVLLARGDLAGAEREARRALAARDAFPPLGGRALGVLARVLLADGRPDHALEASREGMTALERQGSVLCDESILRLAHIEALLACGERELARGASVEARRSVEIRASHIQSEAMRESFLAIAEHAALRELECE